MLKTFAPYNQATDAELWADFRRGSREAYAFMYEKYARLLYNYGYKIAQDRELTEDCLQDLFLTILETRDRLGPTDSIKYYLMRALRRSIVRKLTASNVANRNPVFSSFLPAQSTDGNPAETGIGFRLDFTYEPTWLDAQITKDRSDALLHELNQLPARQKEALFLKFFDNLSYEEIAGIMGIEQTSAYKIIYKAIASLQKRLVPDLFLWFVVLIGW